MIRSVPATAGPGRIAGFDRLAARRRPLDRLEAAMVRLYLAKPDENARRVLDRLRYVVSFARLTAVQNPDGADIDLLGLLGPHAVSVTGRLEPQVAAAKSLWDVARLLPELTADTRRARASLLAHAIVDRSALEAEVTTRLLAIASGGGGGAGYVFPGAYEVVERAGLVPDLMVGTSIGSLMSMFRARRRQYDPAPMVAAGRSLAWTNVFRVLETEHRYGLPATLRLYLRAAIGSLFRTPGGRPLRISDMEIPLYIVTTGITVDGLAHGLETYEHLLDAEVRVGGPRGVVQGAFKLVNILREFWSRPDALVEMVLGRTAGTEDFDVLDGAGFSASIPGLIHYDVLRDDPHMKALLDDLYARWGITRLAEGGMVSNVPARIAWETAIAGTFGRRNVFVLALDCLAPTWRQPLFLALALAVRAANGTADRAFADLYVPMTQSLSPTNLVPAIGDFLTAIRWGREQTSPHVPFLVEMMRPIPVLPDAAPDAAR